MIRPFTLLTALLAIGSGYYLYQAKHRTKLLDERIASVEQQEAAAAGRIAVLRAEWALENSPSRLADLAAHYLLLTPMQPSQAVSMANLASHLPPPGAPDTVPPVESEPDVAALAGLPRLDRYAGLDYFSPGSGEARPVITQPGITQPGITQPGISQLGIGQLAADALPVGQASPSGQPARQPLAAAAEGVTGAKPAGFASLAASPPAAPVVAKPMAAKMVATKTARPTAANRIAERAVPARREPAAMLTSALGGAYPNLAPPAPLSGSH